MLCPTRKMRNSAVRTSERLLLRSLRFIPVTCPFDCLRSVADCSLNVVASNAFERIARLIGTFPRRACIATAAYGKLHADQTNDRAPLSGRATGGARSGSHSRPAQTHDRPRLRNLGTAS